MISASSNKTEECAYVLIREIEKLDALGLTFAASLVRIAHLDLVMRLHNVTEKEIDVLSFAAFAIQQERKTMKEKQEAAEGNATPVIQGKK